MLFCIDRYISLYCWGWMLFCLSFWKSHGIVGAVFLLNSFFHSIVGPWVVFYCDRYFSLYCCWVWMLFCLSFWKSRGIVGALQLVSCYFVFHVNSFSRSIDLNLCFSPTPRVGRMSNSINTPLQMHHTYDDLFFLFCCIVFPPLEVIL